MSAISMFKGASRVLELSVSDEVGAAFDLRGSALHFTVARESGTIAISKSSADPDEIEILDQAVLANVGKARIKLQPTDTGSLSALDSFTYDVWIVTATERFPIIEPSSFALKTSITTFA